MQNMNRTCERALNAQYARLKARRVAADAACQGEAPEWSSGASSRISLCRSDTADPIAPFYLNTGEYLNRPDEDGPPVPEDNSDENVSCMALMDQALLGGEE